MHRAADHRRSRQAPPLLTARPPRHRARPQVSSHNTAKDCWLSFLGGVYDVTELVQKPGMLAAPMIKAAGTDVSHWFDAKTGDVKYYVCPDTNISRPYVPSGDFVGIAPFAPRSDYNMFGMPWWSDPKYRARRRGGTSEGGVATRSAQPRPPAFGQSQPS